MNPRFLPAVTLQLGDFEEDERPRETNPVE